MSDLNEAFVLNLYPMYFSFSDVVTKKELSWSALRHAKFHLGFGSRTNTTFDSEYAAWSAAVAHYPALLDQLQASDRLSYRGFAMRADMLLKLGVDRFADMKKSVDEDVLRIFDLALEVLDARKLTRATPRVARVSSAKSISWLDVRARIQTPYHREAVLASVRCLPSPLEDKTWSVRLRMPATSDLAIRETQRRFDELVARLGYLGIAVKDVQNGTQIDL
ncbi:hypothetical protein KTD31_00540 [Burkholderia multivorans]|uniref:hypothetical protein n=1 Tax=Burkholderia multivorans TaxID=87883 RepID=UPI001C234234|nr:hypothetical protein [Burkholderia multivorans]MBU9199887.1 hypothetical protein [Burkholderia multivorans]MDN8078994.1 hypothetical protein [Burkholderia multivorans]